ncbi:hypothetical protein LX32DRAFT_22101 [Colletotrichum zoysiae]|uniref:Uncharacterized protein n=1 Tax=Colletotrichum zoysiae TaxID=1216348 RepID=A0AAD9HDJ0_9PEZI|nr:hypothetical protein LX32DRAFT_22101 [Colletotrichum zoysiae]
MSAISKTTKEEKKKKTPTVPRPSPGAPANRGSPSATHHRRRLPQSPEEEEEEEEDKRRCRSIPADGRRSKSHTGRSIHPSIHHPSIRHPGFCFSRGQGFPLQRDFLSPLPSNLYLFFVPPTVPPMPVAAKLTASVTMF